MAHLKSVDEPYVLLGHLKSTGDRTRDPKSVGLKSVDDRMRDPLHVGINAYLIELYSNHVHVLALMP